MIIAMRSRSDSTTPIMTVELLLDSELVLQPVFPVLLLLVVVTVVGVVVDDGVVVDVVVVTTSKMKYIL